MPFVVVVSCSLLACILQVCIECGTFYCFVSDANEFCLACYVSHCRSQIYDFVAFLSECIDQCT